MTTLHIDNVGENWESLSKRKRTRPKWTRGNEERRFVNEWTLTLERQPTNAFWLSVMLDVIRRE